MRRDYARVRARLDGDAHGVARAAAEAVADPATLGEETFVMAGWLAAMAEYAPDLDDARLVTETAARIWDVLPANTGREIAAQARRLEGVAAALAGHHGVAADSFGLALAAARSFGYPFAIAEILFDYSRSLVTDGRPDDAGPLLAEARDIAEKLESVRLHDRIDGLTAELAPEVAAQ
jgi:hypothetical protein